MNLTGQITVKADGDTLLCKAGQADIEFGGYERVPQYADNKLIGFTTKPVAGKVSVTCQHTSETDTIALAEAENVSIVIETDTGTSYLMAGATLVSPPKLSGENGDLALEYSGLPIKEV